MRSPAVIRVTPFLRGFVLVLCVLAAARPRARAIQEVTMNVLEDATSITITTPNYTIPIVKAGFRYSFQRPDGTPIAPPHAEAGIAFTAPFSSTLYNAASTELIESNGVDVHLRVTSTHGDTAEVMITPAEHTVRLQIVPFLPPPNPTPSPLGAVMPAGTAAPSPTPSPTPMTDPPNKGQLARDLATTAAITPAEDVGFVIDAQLGGIGKGYGLGDHGGATALDVKNDDFTNAAPRDNLRFITNFTVFPAQGFAQVLFWDHQKRVEIGENISRLGVGGAKQIDGLYYFIGTMPEIYAAYKAAKIQIGYPDYKPKYAMFEPGWEAYGSLGWNTTQQNVTETVQEYLDRGYQFGWAVVGSRTWRGDPDPITAGTTRFGMWDDGSPGSTDPPRYPDPEAFKQFFRDRNIKLILGLRINMDKENSYYTEAKQNGYFIPDHEPLIDLHNPAALDWYMRGVNLWGVEGFKEDLCCGQGLKYYDAKVNPANARLMEQGSYVIVRQSAYGVPGDISRREDTEFNGYYGPASYVTQLAIAYAASGAPNYYPDIVGGTNLESKALTEQIKRYYIRNATIDAAMPAMSFGYRPWLLGEDVAEQAKRAADWHTRMAPYIYSAAVDSFNTGYPHTLTPLMIAYPDESALYDLRPVQWMLGPSIMAVGACYEAYNTIGGDDCTADVRLPSGIWIDPDTGERYDGPTTIKDYPLPLGKIPVFIGGKGVVIERDTATQGFTAKIYPVAVGGSQYVFTAPDGITTTTITNDNINWDPESLRLYDTTAQGLLAYTIDQTTGAVMFPLEAGHNYRLYTERKVFLPFAEKQ
jgi:hypothetical protein